MSAAWFPSLTDLVSIPADGTMSRTIYQDERVKAVLFGFAAGEELSRHTAASPAIIEIISGAATITLGDQVVEARPGAWIHMPAQLPHSVAAAEPTVLLLLLLR